MPTPELAAPVSRRDAPRGRTVAPSVLVVGGTGAFGRRLVEGLVRTTDFDVVIAARDLGRARAAGGSARRRGGRARCASTRATVTARGAARDRRLCRRRCGRARSRAPNTSSRAPRSRPGLHYLDLADARDFVAGFAALDAAGARGRGRRAERRQLDPGIVARGARPADRGLAADRYGRDRDLRRATARRRAGLVGDAGDPLLCRQAGARVRRRRVEDPARLGPCRSGATCPVSAGAGCRCARRPISTSCRRDLRRAKLGDVPRRARTAASCISAWSRRACRCGRGCCGRWCRSPGRSAGLPRGSAGSAATAAGWWSRRPGSTAPGRRCAPNGALVAEAGDGPAIPTLPALAAIRALADGTPAATARRPARASASLDLDDDRARIARYRIATRTTMRAADAAIAVSSAAR